MSGRTYHHGNLRTALLEQAELTVRERGVEDLSLRELAREVGVSHGAPRRHFQDRQALLDALAEAGFARLGEELQSAVDGAGEDFQMRLRATAAAYVRFAIRDPALLELMFAGKHREESGALSGQHQELSRQHQELSGQHQELSGQHQELSGQHEELSAQHQEKSGALNKAAEQAFSVMLELIQQGQDDGVLEPGEPERVGLVLFATIQGIAALLTAGMVGADQLDELVADAIAHFLRGSRTA